MVAWSEAQHKKEDTEKNKAKKTGAHTTMGTEGRLPHTFITHAHSSHTHIDIAGIH